MEVEKPPINDSLVAKIAMYTPQSSQSGDSSSDNAPEETPRRHVRKHRRRHDVNNVTLRGQNDSDSSMEEEKSRHLVKRLQQETIQFIRQYHRLIRIIIYTVLFVAFVVYFAFAIRYNMEGAMALIVITALAVSNIIYEWVKEHFGSRIYRGILKPPGAALDKIWPVFKWFLFSLMIIAVILYLVFDVIKTAKQLQSLAGLALFFFIPMITCNNPKHIHWRTVLWGMGLQFVIGVLVLRWVYGYNAIKFLATEINKFLSYSLDGGALIFGNPTFVLHPFAMIVVPLVVYLGCVNAMLYYGGVIQWIAVKLGWLMSLTLQTTAIESISLVVNIFLSVVDVVLMMKEYLPKLTDSEFHCFLVAAHSTIAGFAFGLFVLFGVNAQHLMTGAVMSAPAAVAIAKLNFPETQESAFKSDKDLRLSRGADTNVIDAGIRGAVQAGLSVGTILVQTIAFTSLILFVDASLQWMFALVGVQLDIATLLGYMFMPFAFLMGVDWEDTLTVGRLIGLKLTANEFLAYLDLGRLIRLGQISDRSAAIATYAMCGFSSFGTLVIFSGVWAKVDASRVAQVTREIPRIMMNSNISCFMTACIASLLYTEDVIREENTQTAILGDMARWFIDLTPELETIKQNLLNVVYTTTL